MSCIKAGVDFEFVDIADNHAIDEAECLAKLQTGKYAGVLFNNSYGKVYDNKDFFAQVKAIDSRLITIDDHCLCVPRLTENIKPNVDLELYSTGYAKYVEFGYGGWGLISDDKMYGESQLTFSQDEEDAMEATIKQCLTEGLRLPQRDYDWLDSKPLENIDEYNEKIKQEIEKVKRHKELINSIYSDGLPKEIQWSEELCQWRYMISVPEPKKILKAIFDHKLFAGTNYPSISYLFKGEHKQKAEAEHSHIINLFNDHRVNEEFAHNICKIISDTL